MKPIPQCPGRPAVLAAILVAGLLAVSCQSRGVNSAVVSGKVTYKGAPVTGGKVTFHSPTAGPVPGPINPDGTYSFGGVAPGEMKVTVETESARQAASMDYTKMMKPPAGMKESATPTPVYVPIPAKYANEATTPLTVKVASGNNTINLELTD